MKILALTSLLVFFFSQNIWATAICSTGRSKVLLNDNYTLEVSGLAGKGIKSGGYTCVVVGAGPGFLSTQREIQCTKMTDQRVSIMGWMIEGVNIFGQQSASVALYNNVGQKVFEAGCKRN
jgi:hypothetical protein